jgi:hypothetical protein
VGACGGSGDGESGSACGTWFGEGLENGAEERERVGAEGYEREGSEEKERHGGLLCEKGRGLIGV